MSAQHMVQLAIDLRTQGAFPCTLQAHSLVLLSLISICGNSIYLNLGQLLWLSLNNSLNDHLSKFFLPHLTQKVSILYIIELFIVHQV